jgi:dihydroneopterin aldolase
MNKPPLASVDDKRRHVFVHGLRLDAEIGVHAGEHGRKQPIRINVDMSVAEGAGAIGDRLSSVVDYEAVADSVRAIVDAGHTRLVETLAERIAARVLEDIRVLTVRVRVEKLAVSPDIGSVGVEIERGQNRSRQDSSA